MLSEAIEHNLRFNQHIFQPGVAFFKLVIAGDETPQDFGSFAASAIFQHIAVFLAERFIGGHFTDDVLRHLHGIPNLHAVEREPVAKTARGDITLCDIQSVIVKAGIMCGYLFNAPLLDSIQHSPTDFVGACHLAATRPQFLDIAGDFPIIISRPHKVTLITENVTIDITRGFVDIALGVYNRPTAVIYKDIGHIQAIAILDSVGGFGINHQDIVFALVNFFHLVKSFLLIKVYLRSLNSGLSIA
nr:MAG TPA: hypothetical protein [Caudoviricetes sp.]